MSENLSPESAEKIRALCRKISVTHNIDEEIQQELYSHMEDKFLGYLSGEEKITEDDAFILVKEHFGKPEYVQSLLEEVHEMETHVSIMRKLGAIYIATFLIITLIKPFIDTLFQTISPIPWPYNLDLSIHHIGGYFFPDQPTGIIYSIYFLLPYFLSLFFFGYIIYHWRKGMEEGRKQWFETLNSWLFVSLVLFISCILPFMILKLRFLITLHYHGRHSFFWISNGLLNLGNFELYTIVSIVIILSFSLIGYIIYRWLKSIKKDQNKSLNPWLYLALVLFLTCILPLMVHSLTNLFPMGTRRPGTFWLDSFRNLDYSEYIVSPIIVCLVWIWWFNEPIRKLRYTVLGFLSWFYFIEMLEQNLGAIIIMSNSHPEKTVYYLIKYTSIYINSFNVFSSDTLKLIKSDETQCGLVAVVLFLIVALILDRRKKDHAVVIQQ